MAVEKMQILRTCFTMRKTREQPHCLIQYDMWVVFILLGMFFFSFTLGSLLSPSHPKIPNKETSICLSLSGELIIATWQMIINPHLMGSVV